MRNGAHDPIVFGLIPAKGSSSGLPGKNMMLMAGNPMIHYILASALDTNTLKEVWVSTENDQIEAYCSNQGARVFRHDPALSDNTSSTFGVIANILGYWEQSNNSPAIVVTMRATSPLCTSADIDQAVQMLISSEADAVVAVTRSDVHPHRILVIDSEGFLRHFDLNSIEKNYPIRRQELSAVYVRTGAIYVTRREVIKQGSLWGTKVLPFVMPKERSVNVNDNIDFFLAEKILTES